MLLNLLQHNQCNHCTITVSCQKVITFDRIQKVMYFQCKGGRELGQDAVLLITRIGSILVCAWYKVFSLIVRSMGAT